MALFLCRGRGVCRVMETRLYRANATTMTQKQSDYKVEQPAFNLIALFWLEIGLFRGRNWPNGNQALNRSQLVPIEFKSGPSYVKHTLAWPSTLIRIIR